MTKIRGHQIPYLDKAERCMELVCYMAAAIMILPILLFSEWSPYTSFGAILSYILMGRAFRTLWKIDITSNTQMFYLLTGSVSCAIILMAAVGGIYGVISTHAGIPINAAIQISFVCVVVLNISTHMALKGGET